MTKIIIMTIPTRTRDPKTTDWKRIEAPDNITETKFSPKEFEMQEGLIINFCYVGIVPKGDTLASRGDL
jgi:hypothetical protein